MFDLKYYSENFYVFCHLLFVNVRYYECCHSCSFILIRLPQAKGFFFFLAAVGPYLTTILPFLPLLNLTSPPNLFFVCLEYGHEEEVMDIKWIPRSLSNYF